MMGQSVTASDPTVDGRMFIYEVKGLSQNDQTCQSAFPIRSSGSLLFSVSHSRMGTFMKRMNRLGGQIVAIHSSWEEAVQSDDSASDTDAAPDAEE